MKRGAKDRTLIFTLDRQQLWRRRTNRKMFCYGCRKQLRLGDVIVKIEIPHQQPGDRFFHAACFGKSKKDEPGPGGRGNVVNPQPF